MILTSQWLLLGLAAVLIVVLIAGALRWWRQREEEEAAEEVRESVWRWEMALAALRAWLASWWRRRAAPPPPPAASQLADAAELGPGRAERP